MSTIVGRLATAVSITVEAWASYDGQGKPSYSAGVASSAIIHAMQAFEQTSDGTGVELTLHLWIPTDAAVIPDEKDRITYSGETYIVYDRRPVVGISNPSTTHYKVRCVDE